MVIARRNLMGGKALPYDYRVEYIHPNGETVAYIDTGVVFDINTDVRIRGKILNTSAAWNVFYWARSTTGSFHSSMCVITGSSKGRFAKVGNNNASSVQSVVYDNDDFVFYTQGRKFYLNGNEYDFIDSDGNSSSVNTLIFALNQGDGVNTLVSDSGTCVSSMEIWKSGELVRDMISVVSNGTPTLYDSVTKTNLPTFGQIMAGPRI